MAATALNPRAVRSLSCPSCGAAIAVRGFGWTQTVVCASCSAVLDAQDPNLAILRRFQSRMTVEPLIPLGARGQWKGAPYEMIGVQQRTIRADGQAFSWREYLLFNPYQGYRYLTEYDGHWNDVAPLPGLPAITPDAAQSLAYHEGESFRHFQTARAETTFVVGEFPWEVQAGDVVEVRDYTAPPRTLSAESTDDEVTWSLATYVDGAAVWRAFALEGDPPEPRGVYVNQPNPLVARASARWAVFRLLALLLVVLFVGRLVTSRRDESFARQYNFSGTSPVAGGAAQAAPFVTPSFELGGRSGNVVVETEADLSNQWLFVDYALVNEATGQAYDFGREVGYYSGRDSDGDWTEGSKRDRARIGDVPGGRYFLRVEPSGDAGPGRSFEWRVRVRRDVPNPLYYALGFLALLIPPVLGTLRSHGFETRRWAESDHAPVASGDDDEEDE
jgi:hypothetical protein